MRERGFTLMETLVAFAVFSMASVALLDVYSRASQARIAADANSQLARRAAGLIAEAELMAAVRPLADGEDADGTRWRVTIRPATGRLMQIEAHLQGPRGREATFRTLRSRAELGLEAPE